MHLGFTHLWRLKCFRSFLDKDTVAVGTAELYRRKTAFSWGEREVIAFSFEKVVLTPIPCKDMGIYNRLCEMFIYDDS